VVRGEKVEGKGKTKGKIAPMKRGKGGKKKNKGVFTLRVKGSPRFGGWETRIPERPDKRGPDPGGGHPGSKSGVGKVQTRNEQNPRRRAKGKPFFEGTKMKRNLDRFSRKKPKPPLGWVLENPGGSKWEPAAGGVGHQKFHGRILKIEKGGTGGVPPGGWRGPKEKQGEQT